MKAVVFSYMSDLSSGQGGELAMTNSTIQHYTPLELAKMIRDESKYV